MTPSDRLPSLEAGPVLYARGATPVESQLTVLAVTREGDPAPVLEPEGGAARAMTRRAMLFGHAVWTSDFTLPAKDAAAYRVNGEPHTVRTDLGGDLRVAFVSCNGQEEGDEDRSHEDRDVMWRRLAQEHESDPFVLLLQGGDQLYADEAVKAHPETARWHELPVERRPEVAWEPAMAEAVRGYFFRRYLQLFRQPAMRILSAGVPTMMIWDDHDIFDGWGSHPPALQESPVALGLFAAAREMFVLFQLGAGPDALPTCVPDATGASLTHAARFPGFAVILPDLRSERTPARVMGEAGWRALTSVLAEVPDGDRRIVVSSVPALGPRLSLVEALLDFYPGQQQYEDDLRDQWQSRGHRAEWIRFLTALEREAIERAGPLTVVSGEIHLATRGEMRLRDGTAIHQLVASGITHPKPPRAMAIGLGLLSRLGHAPLRGRPVRLKALPGKSATYTAERNYLVLTRRADRWSAAWELEESGRTPALDV
ncbi:alkaline phosphatase D family protein [Aureimonas sp. AU12]|uniref:alkaline phosphatase D family protein n=1 Tax=Aureimonas sp. AU12 TaxID=1638161 RepID=UPI0007803B73|nr:alkaline phosphatase D family protein [Aureimonas sp. AU12]